MPKLSAKKPFSYWLIADYFTPYGFEQYENVWLKIDRESRLSKHGLKMVWMVKHDLSDLHLITDYKQVKTCLEYEGEVLRGSALNGLLNLVKSRQARAADDLVAKAVEQHNQYQQLETTDNGYVGYSYQSERPLQLKTPLTSLLMQDAVTYSIKRIAPNHSRLILNDKSCRINDEQLCILLGRSKQAH